jgi:hypothetical protein
MTFETTNDPSDFPLITRMAPKQPHVACPVAPREALTPASSANVPRAASHDPAGDRPDNSHKPRKTSHWIAAVCTHGVDSHRTGGTADTLSPYSLAAAATRSSKPRATRITVNGTATGVRTRGRVTGQLLSAARRGLLPR